MYDSNDQFIREGEQEGPGSGGVCQAAGGGGDARVSWDGEHHAERAGWAYSAFKGGGGSDGEVRE